MEKRHSINPKLLAKFILCSLIGVIAFMIPFYYQGSVNTVVGVLTDVVKRLLSVFMNELILALVGISALGSLFDFFQSKVSSVKDNAFHKIFQTSPIYLMTKLFALLVVVLYEFGVGPDLLIGEAVGGTMINLGGTLVALAIALSYLLPFLTDAGLMEFVGELTKPFVRPLFKVPSDASIDLIASWLGASNAAVILSAEKYRKGFYTKREVACVMTNFSLVSIPFCLVIATTTGTENYFPAMYGLLILLGILLAVITPRIYPLNCVEDTYFENSRHVDADHRDESLIRRSLLRSCQAAASFDIKAVLNSGTAIMKTICLNLLPTVIGWGVLGLLVVEHTPVFEWLSLPMGWYLHILGVEGAYAVAPATLAGFVDMFIPALLVTSVLSVKTRFIIATLSLIQIIYITEVGAVIIQTDCGINLKRLFVIFLERTLISIPIIVGVSHLIF